MELINCVNCGRLMLRKTAHLCADCLIIRQEDIRKIKAFLAEHPGASIMEVQRMTGVAIKTILEISSNP